MNDVPALSVVMPVYNEQDAIVAAVDEVRRHVLDQVPGAELVVVDDGSRDGTGPRLDALSAADARVRVIHQANRGHGGALLSGLAAARGTAIFLVDSDRQIPLDNFPAAWRTLQACDAVFGVRRRRDDPRVRLWITRLVRVAVRCMFGVRIEDANVPYKLVRREVWEEARPLVPEDTLAPSLFVAIVARRRGRDVREIDVPHRARSTGVVSIRRFKLLRFCARGLSQMVALRRRV